MDFKALKAELSDEWISMFNRIQSDTEAIPYEAFTEAALYDPRLGYYAKLLDRVGKSHRSDFYTSSSHNAVFPELVRCAVSNLSNMESHTFVEIGAESGSSPFESRFEDVQTLKLGDPLHIPERAVVFSNELFDAQPFQRWIYLEGQWQPLRLKLEGNLLSETVEGTKKITENEAAVLDRLPTPAAEGYRLDISYRAEQLLEKIVRQSWSGLFIAIDYGHMWNTLLTEFPEGTARAYYKHQQVPNLLERPGEQDLTSHVCWDFLKSVLVRNGFTSIQLKSQEAFFMLHSQNTIKQIVEGTATLASALKSQLLELISPGYFGQKFQVLYGKRDIE